MVDPIQAKAGEAASSSESSLHAIEESVDAVLESVGTAPDLTTLFFSPHHRDSVRPIMEVIHDRLRPKTLIGSSMAGVVGSGREYQVGPGLALWAARLPETRVFAYHLELEPDHSRIIGWPDMPVEASSLMIADPFSFPLEPFFSAIRGLGELPILFGGIASGSSRDGKNLMVFDHAVTLDGAVGCVLDGAYRFEPVVAQGCTPLGPPFEVTRCEGNVMLELGGRPAYSELNEVLTSVSAEQRRQFMRAPHVGITPMANRSGEQGRDLLVRGVMGVDPDAGAVAVSEQLGEGVSVQFQARDRDAADCELKTNLEMASSFCYEVVGALQFSCTGRGLQLFQAADHDVSTLHKYWPDLPVSGAFVAGEIGPVCGLPYIHGLATSIGLIVRSE